nr:cleavage and polyadenylation specificity factor subunit 2 [Tanacetum cinerariifolium]
MLVIQIREYNVCFPFKPGLVGAIDNSGPLIILHPNTYQKWLVMTKDQHGPATPRENDIIFNMSKPDNTMAQVFTEPSSSITKMDNDVATQLQTSLLRVLALPTNPVNKSSKVQQEMVIPHPTNLYEDISPSKSSQGQVHARTSLVLVITLYCALSFLYPEDISSGPPMHPTKVCSSRI